MIQAQRWLAVVFLCNLTQEQTEDAVLIYFPALGYGQSNSEVREQQFPYLDEDSVTALQVLNVTYAPLEQLFQCSKGG